MAELKVQKLAVNANVLEINYELIGKTLKLDLSKLSAHDDNARIHGWKQRFGDLEAGDKTGHKKFERAQALFEHLSGGGDWNMSGERDTTAVVIEAILRIEKKYTREQLEAAAEAKPEQVKAWRANPKVKATIAKIYAERAAKVAKDSSDELTIEM